MLARNIDEINIVYYPQIGQPKLNGLRACWDGKHLISRQRIVWSEHKLPHIYEKLRAWSSNNPGIALDGELYEHGMPLQEINKRCAINSVDPHDDCGRVDYHAFDIIGDGEAEERLMTLSQIYKPWVAVCHVENTKSMELWLDRFCEAGYEGMMLRDKRGRYEGNRSDGLLKIKPWTYAKAMIVGFNPGEGKYKGVLGSLRVKPVGFEPCNVSGGLTDDQRVYIWENQKGYDASVILIRFRDVSNAKRPLMPQVVKL